MRARSGWAAVAMTVLAVVRRDYRRISLPVDAGRPQQSPALLGCLRPAVGLRDHEAGQSRIGGGPGIGNLGRPLRTEPALQSPQQCLADHRIMLWLRTVVDVALGQGAR